MSDDARQYRISGALVANPGIWRSLTATDGTIAATTLGVMLLSSFSHAASWVPLVTLVIGGGLISLLHLRTSAGSLLGESGFALGSRLLLIGAGWTSHDGENVPGLLSDVTVTDPAGTDTTQGVALIRVPGRGYRDTALCAVVMLGGSAVGEGDYLGEDQQAHRFESFLNRLAEGTLPVDQVDVVTRVSPDMLTAYMAVAEPQLIGPPMAVAALMGLATEMTGLAAKARSWMVIRMPYPALESFRRGPESDAALDCLDQVLRIATDQGLSPTLVLTPSRVSALVRWLYNPDEDIDFAGTSVVWDGVTSFESHRTHIATAGEWCHSTGVVRVNDWPWSPVWADVLRPIVVAPGRDAVVTVQAQFRLTPRHIALKKAQVGAALAEGYRIANAGRVSTGEEDDQWLSANDSLTAIRHGAAGVAPLLRICVSVKDPEQIRDVRGDIETRMLSAGFTSMSWTDHDHARQVACLAPTSRGIEFTK